MSNSPVTVSSCYLWVVIFLFLCMLQAATQQVDEVMKEMLEQKKKLAYEKGNLQSEVEQLQSQVHSLQNKNIQVSIFSLN